MTPERAPPDLRRFAHAHAGDLWQSDIMHGPKCGDGRRRRKTYMIVMIDDATRIVPWSAFAFSEGINDFLPVFRQALLRRGIPKKLFVDNGSAYRSRRLDLVCARLGIALIHARPYHAAGNVGKEGSTTAILFFCQCGLGLRNRTDDDLYPPVLGTPTLGKVRCNRLSGTFSICDDAARRDPFIDQHLGDGEGAASRQVHVVGIAFGIVCMPHDLDVRTWVTGETVGHGVDVGQGSRPDVGTAGGERDGLGYGHDQFGPRVCDFYAPVSQGPANLFFLVIQREADCASEDSSCNGALKGIVAVVAKHFARDRAKAGPDDRARYGIVRAFPGRGIAGRQGGCANQAQYRQCSRWHHVITCAGLLVEFLR